MPDLKDWNVENGRLVKENSEDWLDTVITKCTGEIKDINNRMTKLNAKLTRLQNRKTRLQMKRNRANQLKVDINT